jgi:hypothetical protein
MRVRWIHDSMVFEYHYRIKRDNFSRKGSPGSCSRKFITNEELQLQKRLHIAIFRAASSSSDCTLNSPAALVLLLQHFYEKRKEWTWCLNGSIFTCTTTYRWSSTPHNANAYILKGHTKRASLNNPIASSSSHGGVMGRGEDGESHTAFQMHWMGAFLVNGTVTPQESFECFLMNILLPSSSRIDKNWICDNKFAIE